MEPTSDPAADPGSAPGASAAHASQLVWLATCELLLVALLWGTTNPCLNRASKQKEKQQAQGTPPPPAGIWSLLLNWRFLGPFLLNQLGSLLYLHCLPQLALSFAVPTVNAMAMIVTAVTAHALGERSKSNTKIWIGMALMLAGICVCILSQQQQQAQAEVAPV